MVHARLQGGQYQRLQHFCPGRGAIAHDEIGWNWSRSDGLPLPLWERHRPLLAAVLKNAEAKLRLCRIERCDPGEGSLSASPTTFRLADRDPSSGASRHLLPQGEKEGHREAR